MGLYERWVLPRLTDLAMRHKEATRYRGKLVPAAAGSVLEIGAGSGLNLAFYGPRVTEVHALDPSQPLLAMVEKRARKSPVPVDLLAASAEEIPLASQSVDTVVSTWSLCTIADPLKALREARRVLKPGGELLFVEHGHAPDASVARWQARLEPLWKRIAGGCRLSRPIDRLIREAGFDITALENEYLQGPRPFTYTYCGRARATSV